LLALLALVVSVELLAPLLLLTVAAWRVVPGQGLLGIAAPSDL